MKKQAPGCCEDGAKCDCNPPAKSKKNKLIKIAAPILIVLVIAGIWIVKNSGKDNNKSDGSSGNANISENADFALDALSLDLEQLKSYGLPIMIDFGADQCIPCKQMAPVLRELNAEYQEKVIVKFVDVWKYQSLASDFPVELIPTQFFFTADGKPFVPSNPEGMGMQMYTDRTTGEHIFTAHQGGMTKQMILEVFKEMGVKV